MNAKLIEAARAVVDAAYRMSSNAQLGNLMPEVSKLSSALAAEQPAEPVGVPLKAPMSHCRPNGIAYDLPPLIFTAAQLREALAFFGGEEGDEDDPVTVSIALRDEGNDIDGEPRPRGLYVWMTEYPEEGSLVLDGASYAAPPAQPAPAGWVMVPLRLTQAMREVIDSDGWDWGELLAAAEAATEAECAIATESDEGASPAAPAQAAEDCERRPYGDLRNAKWLDPECYAKGACQSLLFKAAAPAQVPQPLSESRLLDIADDFRSQYSHGGVTFDEFDALGFARAIERAHGITKETT